MREFNPRSIPVPKLDGIDLSSLEHPNLDLEIGAGQGLHAIRYAAEHPDRTLVAIERTRVRYERLHSRARRHPHIKNLMPVRADAVAFVRHFVRESSLSRVFLLYPNPYPKSRQANLRWHQHPFIQCLHTKLTPDGSLHLATNMGWYAEEAVNWLVESGRFELVHHATVPRHMRPRTHFEAKYLERGETCFDLIFKKRIQ